MRKRRRPRNEKTEKLANVYIFAIVMITRLLK